MFPLQQTAIEAGFVQNASYQHYSADAFPYINPIHWLTSHFAVGGWSPLKRISGMLTAHMTRIAPRNGFTWHPHRALEIYTWVLEGELYHEDTTGGKGIIKTGELQRMFAGDYIEHQELNLSDEPARVIQIWYVADRHHRGLQPHYQQVGRSDLPRRRLNDATVFDLIGEASPMTQHMTGRLTATTVDAGGTTTIENPREGEDLFLYVTDGSGKAVHQDARATGMVNSLGQYDVILAQPEADSIAISASDDAPLHYMNFYLPSFINA